MGETRLVAAAETSSGHVYGEREATAMTAAERALRRDAPADTTKGQRMIREVSTMPASREDVVALHEALRIHLQIRRARPEGDCPIRREIYDNVFGELVRQVTIEEPARGIMLQRIWDELKHTLRVHRDMVAHGQEFAARKLLSAQDGVAELQARIAALRRDKNALLTQRYAIEKKVKVMDDQINSDRIRIAKEQRDEITYLHRANQQLSVRFKAETVRSTNTTIHVAS